MQNIFDLSSLCDCAVEKFETLAQRPGVHIERIVSYGHPTPRGEWYDQSWDEWVMLVRGTAQISYQTGEAEEMGAGSWLLLPAGCKHRVERVSGDAIWLAVHFK